MHLGHPVSVCVQGTRGWSRFGIRVKRLSLGFLGGKGLKREVKEKNMHLYGKSLQRETMHEK